MERTQVVLILCNIGTLIAFIWFGSCQHFDTKDSVALSDSSYNISRRALDFQKRQWVSDSISQHEKDSIFVKNQKFRDSLNLESFMLENRAYLNFKDVQYFPFKIGEKIRIYWESTNTGKTPAYRVRQMTDWIALTDWTDKEFDNFHASHDTGVVVGSGLPYSHPSEDAIIADSVELIYFKKIPIYVRVIIEYDDLFHRMHRTRGHFVYQNDTLNYLRKFNDAN